MQVTDTVHVCGFSYISYTVNGIHIKYMQFPFTEVLCGYHNEIDVVYLFYFKGRARVNIHCAVKLNTDEITAFYDSFVFSPV